MTWPYERLDWVSLDQIVGAHRRAEAELGAKVAPVGVAMANALTERPDLAMLGPDAEHESAAGIYLAAAVIYATVFDRTPEGLPYHHMLSEDDAAFLQRVAWDTVKAWRQGVPALRGRSPGRGGRRLPDLPVLVTGTESCGSNLRRDRRGGRDRVVSRPRPRVRGYMSDPRVTGTYTNTFNSRCLAPSSNYPGEMCLFWGTHVLDGPEGGWDCAYQGSDDPTRQELGTPPSHMPRHRWLRGSDYVWSPRVRWRQRLRRRDLATTASSTRARPRASRGPCLPSSLTGKNGETRPRVHEIRGVSGVAPLGNVGTPPVSGP